MKFHLRLAIQLVIILTISFCVNSSQIGHGINEETITTEHINYDRNNLRSRSNSIHKENDNFMKRYLEDPYGPLSEIGPYSALMRATSFCILAPFWVTYISVRCTIPVLEFTYDNLVSYPICLFVNAEDPEVCDAVRKPDFSP